MRIAFQLPEKKWFKAESAAAVSALVALVGAVFHLSPDITQGLMVVLGYLAAFITVE